VATYRGGEVSREELLREASRLPAVLRQQFETPAGKRELAASIVDKRLLVEEARRRGLHANPDIQQQVRELEERLLVKALVEAEQNAAGAPTEAELRAHYEQNKESFRLPERVHFLRVLASVPAGATTADRQRARARAEGFLRRLKAGEAFAKVQASGDGPERAREGDFGTHVPEDLGDRRLAMAVLALEKPGQLSGVVEADAGYAVLKLVEKLPSRLRSFEEVRSEVEGHIQPSRHRKAFDALRARLRTQADVKVGLSGLQ
jgi:peptidyl-prolyl cis-trans isomerase C